MVLVRLSAIAHENLTFENNKCLDASANKPRKKNIVKKEINSWWRRVWMKMGKPCLGDLF